MWSEGHLLVRFTDICLNSTSSPALYLFYSYATLSLSLINVILNGLALYVFQYPQWKTNPMICLLKSFATLETCFNVWLFLHLLCEVVTPSKFLLPGNVRGALLLETMLLVLDCCVLACQMTRNWAVVALAYARYAIICRTSLIQRRSAGGEWFTRPRVCYSVVVVAVVVFFLLSVPRKLEDITYLCVTDGSYVHSKEFLNSSSWFRILYKAILLFLIQSGGPVGLVIMYSIAIILKIRQPTSGLLNSTATSGTDSCAAGQRQRRRQNQLNSASVLIIALCITFTVLEMPSFVNKLLTYHGDESYIIYLGLIANICVYLDSTVNFFVYICSNRLFRECLLQGRHSRATQIEASQLASSRPLADNNRDKTTYSSV